MKCEIFVIQYHPELQALMHHLWCLAVIRFVRWRCSEAYPSLIGAGAAARPASIGHVPDTSHLYLWTAFNEALSPANQIH